MPEATAAHGIAADQTGPRVAMVSAFLATAGLPLYIHLPSFAAMLGLPLATIGALLLAMRLLDFLQDPALGWLVEKAGSPRRPALAALAFFGIGTGFAAVFVLQPGLAVLVAGLALIFTAWSLGTILFYAQGVALAEAGVAGDHYRLATWREAGGLAGILAAALVPALVGSIVGPLAGYAALGAIVAVAAPLVWWLGTPIWKVPSPAMPFSPRDLIRSGAGRLLLLATVNALPVAITSTLFLFFVGDKLKLSHLAGPLLALFFVAAAITVPLWSRAAERFGARRVLLVSMTLAVAAFASAGFLPAGAALGFAAITLASGAALGAEMVILPALFSRTLARAGLPPALGFGAWAFAGKLSLALAAAIVLPMLDFAGYVAGGPNDTRALFVLTAAYAFVPLFLKLPAMAMVAALSDEVSR